MGPSDLFLLGIFILLTVRALTWAYEDYKRGDGK